MKSKEAQPKFYVLSHDLAQAIVNYITANPSANLPVSAAIQLIGQIQALPDLGGWDANASNAAGDQGTDSGAD